MADSGGAQRQHGLRVAGGAAGVHQRGVLHVGRRSLRLQQQLRGAGQQALVCGAGFLLPVRRARVPLLPQLLQSCPPPPLKPAAALKHNRNSAGAPRGDPDHHPGVARAHAALPAGVVCAVALAATRRLTRAQLLNLALWIAQVHMRPSIARVHL